MNEGLVGFQRGRSPRCGSCAWLRTGGEGGEEERRTGLSSTACHALCFQSRPARWEQAFPVLRHAPATGVPGAAVPGCFGDRRSWRCGDGCFGTTHAGPQRCDGDKHLQWGCLRRAGAAGCRGDRWPRQGAGTGLAFPVLRGTWGQCRLWVGTVLLAGMDVASVGWRWVAGGCGGLRRALTSGASWDVGCISVMSGWLARCGGGWPVTGPVGLR